MDILRDVQKAEEEAAKIESEYQAKVQGLVAEGNEEIRREREKLEADLDREITEYGTQLESELEQLSNGIRNDGDKERKGLKDSAQANHEQAVSFLLSNLGL